MGCSEDVAGLLKNSMTSFISLIIWLTLSTFELKIDREIGVLHSWPYKTKNGLTPILLDQSYGYKKIVSNIATYLKNVIFY